MLWHNLIIPHTNLTGTLRFNYDIALCSRKPPLYTSGSRRITLKTTDLVSFYKDKLFENSLFSSIANNLNTANFPLRQKSIRRGISLLPPKPSEKLVRRGTSPRFQEEMGELSGSLNIVTLGHNSTHSFLTAPHLWGICQTFHYLFLFLFQCANKISFRFCFGTPIPLQTKSVISQRFSSTTDSYIACATAFYGDTAHFLVFLWVLQSFLFGYSPLAQANA